VYDDCLGWFKKIRARIIVQRRLEFIKAFHRRTHLLARDETFGSWHPKDWDKYIDIFFYEFYDQVKIRIIIERPKGFHTQAAIDKRKRWWIPLVVDLYKNLNVEFDISQKKDFFPIANLHKMISDIWWSFMLPLSGSLFFWVWGFFILLNDEFFGYFLLVAGLITPLQIIYEVYQIRKRLRELYPDR